MKTISIIIPVFNEEANLVWHHKSVKKFLETKKIRHEILYVNDGSSDESLNILRQIASKDNETRYLSLSRNFGKEAATTAGLNTCKGDAAIIVDADGQHPVKYIEQFIEEWSRGADVVVGVRKSNKGEGFTKKYGSKLFYKILNILTNDNTTPSSTDFRLVDRKVIDEFNKLTERTRITRGLIDWLGFR
jgi:dolichol-phosphate mannosyltransferase